MRQQEGRARFRSKAERNLAIALGECARITAALDLPWSARERASVIYRQAQREGLPIGRSIEIPAAGSVYAACRGDGLTRTVDEVASVARCSKAKLELGYRVLNRELGLRSKVARPAEYIPKLASTVGAPDAVRIRAHELAGWAEDDGIANGRHPGGVAAACVYLAGHEAGQLYTQQELCDVVDVTPTTLRQRCRELRDRME